MAYTGCDGGNCTPQAGDHLNAATLMSIFANAGYDAGVLTYDPGPPGKVNRPDLLINLTAVGLRESDGWSKACNPASGTVGVLQFQPRYFDKTRACDPQTAAAMFYEVWKADGWKPWAGDITGGPGTDGVLTGARSRLAEAQQAYKDFTGGDPGPVGGGGFFGSNPFDTGCHPPSGFSFLNPLAYSSYLACLIRTAFTFIFNPETWIRFGEVIGGFVLLILALIFLFRHQISEGAERVGKAAAIAAV